MVNQNKTEFPVSTSSNNHSSRNIGIDLFRLLCMFLITSIHLEYTNISDVVSSCRVDSLSLTFLNTLQLVGINGFMLISAYYLSSKPFSIKRVVSFWIQLLFCSIFTFILMTAITRTFSILNCIKSIFPVLTQHYWYPIPYIIILLASPFFNLLIGMLSKKKFELLLVLFFGSQIILFSINPFFDSTVYLGHYSHGLIWHIFLYFIAAFIKKYGIERKMLFSPLLFLITFVIAFSLKSLLDVQWIKLPENVHLFTNNGLFALLLTVSAFITFSQLKIKNKIVIWCIKNCSPTLFFVYLIQEHNSVRSEFWNFIAKTENILSNPILLAIIAFVILLVVAILFFQIYKLAKKICLDKIEEFICSKLHYLLGKNE